MPPEVDQVGSQVDSRLDAKRSTVYYRRMPKSDAAISFPAKAVAHFDQVAAEISASIEAGRPLVLQRRASSLDHVPRAGKIGAGGAEILRHGPILEFDDVGLLCGARQFKDGKVLQIPASAASRLERLAWDIANRSEASSRISATYVRAHLIDWAFLRRAGAHGGSWMEYLAVRNEESVARLEIAIPLEGFTIEREFKIGATRFSFYTASRVKEMVAVSMPPTTSAKELAATGEGLAKLIQGHVHAIVEVIGEPSAAHDAAVEQTERALDLIRFLSLAAGLPHHQCFVARRNTVDMNGTTYSVFRDGKFIEHRDSMDPSFGGPTIGREVFAVHGDLIARHSEILLDEARSPLADATLNAMAIFGRGVMARKLEQRLLYALVAMESLLLKDDKESIGSNLALRVAHLIGVDLPDRKDRVRTIKEGYQLRSRFVHHGHPPEDVVKAAEVLQLAWLVLRRLVFEETLRTPEAVVAHLDERILS